MTPRQRENLQRLLKPRHVAVIGGRDAEVVAGECARIGFSGPFWPVNPKRATIGGHRCFARVEDLPEPPDAVFLAVPREAAIETLKRLDAMGAGGVVCYTAGFGETGDADAEAQLVAAVGDLAMVGPNCYGVINYVDRVALWPFAHGGACPGFGAAIITQSGMLSSDFTMSQRSLPFAFMISAGNQTALSLEDFIDALCEREEVRAFGLHVEGLKDVARFEAVALKALRRGIPIVAFKTGTSTLGAELTISHTGSLSGTEDLYDALFDRLGIIKTTSPAQLLETVKLLTVAGPPRGSRLAGLTCSGGGAAMLADYAEKLGLSFPKPAPDTALRLRAQLPITATVSNPLDYTTPIWGIPEKTEPVFQTLFADGYDAAVIVQDYPAPGLDESKPYYRHDTSSFITAAKAHGLTAAVCSTLPENLDAETRDFLVANGVAPMQGIEACLAALASGSWYQHRRGLILDRDLAPRPVGASFVGRSSAGAARFVDEASAKARLAHAGLPVPPGRVVAGWDAPAAAAELGFPIALKMVSDRLPHKTEAGAVRLGLTTPAGVDAAVERMRGDVRRYDAAAVRDAFLVERMVGPPVAELMVSIRHDAQFGYAMTLATGGIFVELIDDAVTILVPAPRADLDDALARLRIARLIEGYRGRPGADRAALLDGLERLVEIVTAKGSGIVEAEINPLFLLPDGICAIDVLLRVGASDALSA